MSDDLWWKQWVYLNGERDPVLHLAVKVAWGGWGNSGEGLLWCGAAGAVWAPGILSRTQAPRCPTCCKLAGVPQGVGNPRNDKPEGASNG